MVQSGNSRHPVSFFVKEVERVLSHGDRRQGRRARGAEGPQPRAEVHLREAREARECDKCPLLSPHQSEISCDSLHQTLPRVSLAKSGFK